jgi:hypothetical protein
MEKSNFTYKYDIKGHGIVIERKEGRGTERLSIKGEEEVQIFLDIVAGFRKYYVRYHNHRCKDKKNE